MPTTDKIIEQKIEDAISRIKTQLNLRYKQKTQGNWVDNINAPKLINAIETELRDMAIQIERETKKQTLAEVVEKLERIEYYKLPLFEGDIRRKVLRKSAIKAELSKLQEQDQDKFSTGLVEPMTDKELFPIVDNILAKMVMTENGRQGIDSILSLIKQEKEAVLNKVETRAWVHINEDDTKTHSEEFGKGWNENADSMIEFLAELKSNV